jgi:hypothetical protein
MVSRARISAMSEASEQEVNRRLRRADWRFLLPTPRPHRAICRTGRALADAVASIADEVVTSGAGDCDLAVAEDPDSLVLAELSDALRPGGACYTEWRGTRSDPRRIERALRNAGFGDVTCYRPWPPSAELPVYWIPLGAPGAAAYVRSRRWLRGGRVRRLLAGARQRARDLVRGQFPRPICAIARRPGASLSGGLDPAAWLREGWSEWRLGPTPERLSTLLVTGGPRSVSKVVLLAFAEPNPIPLLAVKAPRVDAAAAGVRREGTALASLAERGRGPASGVPRILFRREIDGLPLVGETALAGRPLESVLAPRNLAAWSMKVADWLAALGRGASVLPSTYWRDTIVEPVLCRFVEQFGRVADRGMVQECEGIVRSIGALPRVPEQRDFGPWNVLVTSTGEIAVLDWESAAVDGLPALDLLYYLAFASFNVDRAKDLESRLASHRRSLDPSTRTGAVRHDCLARYLDALGLDRASLAPLSVLVWLIHAQSDFRHAAADAGGPPPAGALLRSPFLALWQREVRHAAGR